MRGEKIQPGVRERLSQISVRSAAPADLDRIAAIKVASWRDTYAGLVPADDLAPYLDEQVHLRDLRADVARESTLLLVGDRDGEGIIGFALTYADAEPDPWLESLHVVRAHRSRGAGALLVRATAAWLRGLGHRTMRLGVVAGNHRAMRFYERLGAQHTGQEPAHWAPGVRHEIYRWPDLEPLVHGAAR